jgi:D-psicose/D-tagatose/L-ribulose 3-epimerase
MGENGLDRLTAGRDEVLAPVNAIGANTWIWASPLTDGAIATLVPRVRSFGFDVIELPVEDAAGWDPDAARELLDRHGLRATTCAVMPPGRDLLVDDPDVLRATADYVRAAVDVAARVGSPVLAGPIYSAVGRTWRLDGDERRAATSALVERLRPLADHAGERGVTLALEPLNRFETSFMNTAEQAMEVVERLDERSVGVLLDTFHMNIEERDPAGAIRTCAGRLVHVHACGCDRGAPGGDHIDWPAIAAALRETGYAGAVVIESFTYENQAIARAAAIWRPLAASQDAIATDGLAFLSHLLGGQERPPSAATGRVGVGERSR